VISNDPAAEMDFFDDEKCGRYLEKVCLQYEASAPTVSRYSVDVHQRLITGGVVQINELITLQHLWES